MRVMELYHLTFFILYSIVLLSLKVLGLFSPSYLINLALGIALILVVVVIVISNDELVNFVAILFTYLFNRKAYLEKGLGGSGYDIKPFINVKVENNKITVSTKDENLIRTGAFISEINPPFFKNYHVLHKYIEDHLVLHLDLKTLSSLYQCSFYKPLALTSVAKLNTINFKVRYTFDTFKKELPAVLQKQLSDLKHDLMNNSVIIKNVSGLFNNEDRFIFIFTVELLKNGSTSIRVITNNPFMKFIAISSSVCKYTSCFIDGKDTVEPYALNPAMFVALRFSDEFNFDKFFITTRAWLRVNTAKTLDKFFIENAVLFPIYGNKRKSLIKFVKRVLSRVMIDNYKIIRTQFIKNKSIKYVNNHIINDLVTYGKPGLLFYTPFKTVLFTDYWTRVSNNKTIYLKLF